MPSPKNMKAKRFGRALLTGRSPCDELVPIGKREPVLIMKAEPVEGRLASSGGPARTISAAQRAVVFAWSGEYSGMWREVVTLDGCRRANEFVADADSQLRHRRIVATDSGSGRDRMSRGADEARLMSRWRNGIRAWGRSEPATYHPGSWNAEQATLACSRVG